MRILNPLLCRDVGLVCDITYLVKSQIFLFLLAGSKAFLKGVGPRALSNGLNSAVFFCCFEALKQVGPFELAWSQPASSMALLEMHALLEQRVLDICEVLCEHWSCRC